MMRWPTEQLERFWAGAAGVGRGRIAQPARAFTLLEMLVVVAIIGIITSLALGAMYAATERARRTRTETLIRKLHVELMRRWESYETRRLPIVMMSGETLDDFARRELVARRELMRMELPDRYSDIKVLNEDTNQFEYFASGPFPGIDINTPNNRPPLLQAYLQRLSAAEAVLIASRVDINTPQDAYRELSSDNYAAEMLYLTLSIPFDGDDFIGLISEKYIGDTDGDGMPEFIDAWGNPIAWIRWPAGLLNTDAEGGANPSWGYVTDLHDTGWQPSPDGNPNNDFLRDPDPFDTRAIDVRPVGGADDSLPGPITAPPRLLWGYRTVPLIVSPGTDGRYGLAFGRGDVANADLPALINSYSIPYYFWEEFDGIVRRGTPRLWYYGTDDFATQDNFNTDPRGCVWVHFDNITNHMLEAR